jgi:hypothetical protein
MAIETTDISVETSFPSGMLILSAIVDGHLVRRKYMGYTLREAVLDFKEHNSGRTFPVVWSSESR